MKASELRNMSASDLEKKLAELKAEMEESATIEKFVSLTNPKNITLMESLVAWTSCPVAFDGNADVAENAGMDELWNLSNVNPRVFADTAGLGIQDALAKLRQMRNLGLIFPDGTALSKAVSLVKIYVKGKIEDLG